jgi:hypothetical protein
MYENHEEQTTGQQAPPPPGDQARATPPPHDPGRSTAGPADRKSPLAAVVLSALPGLGQVYVGYYQRGFVHILVVVTTIFLLNQWELQEFQPLLGPFLAFFWIYNMIDAARCANAVNRGAESGIQPELPELPSGVGGGSVFAGGVLVAIGVLILGRTVLGFSLAWLAAWWPVFLIIFGVRLIVTGRRRGG